MTIYFKLLSVLSCATLAASLMVVKRSGWIDRMVEYHRNNFLADLQRLAPVKIQASIEPASPGYVDSTAWNSTSVSRLLALLAANEAAAPVRRVLRRTLRSTRRVISKQQSWSLFPSLGKNHDNEIYYDWGSHEHSSEDENGEEWVNGPPDSAVVVLQNPVEARLPSARISIKLLREILEARAIAARQMPSTVRSTIAWKFENKSTTTKSAPASSSSQDTTMAVEANPGNVDKTGDAVDDGDANTVVEDNEGKSEAPPSTEVAKTENLEGADNEKKDEPKIQKLHASRPRPVKADEMKNSNL